MGIIEIKCHMDREAYKDYTTLAEVEQIFKDDLHRRVANFADCIAFVACTDCLECENKCRLFEAVKADLDTLYQKNNQKYYEYLALMFEALSNREAIAVRN